MPDDPSPNDDFDEDFERGIHDHIEDLEKFIKSPHDRLVRRIFSKPTFAAQLFAKALPPSLANTIDWASLGRKQGSYVDDLLSEHRTDLLFEAKIKDSDDPVLFHLLFEHQRKVDRFMAFRCHTYVSRFLSEWADSHETSQYLPAVLPVVFYNGDKRWTAPRSLSELYPPNTPKLDAGYYPDIQYLFYDLSRVDGAWLLQNIDKLSMAEAVVGLVQVLLSQARKQPLGFLIGKYAKLLTKLKSQRGRVGLLRTLLKYIVSVDKKPVPPTSREQLAHEIGEPATEVSMSWIQQAKRESHKEGRQEGALDAIRQNIKQILQIRLTNVPSDIDERLAALSLQELNAVFQRSVTATSMAQVLSPDS